MSTKQDIWANYDPQKARRDYEKAQAPYKALTVILCRGISEINESKIVRVVQPRRNVPEE
jgi:hypothetical protein